ncbi:MAG: ABC transporter substrate-binding protein [Actinophytocola sp.]|uniref:amino acid ABC transporter substrate-binding protein n=1 Tax=Actinophytocola sp. TaxID=1872138 RepID=UPI0013278FD3|nr:amino acid ABC transporter substrate-binding protein [Actinophytocola sp.]MPZ79752.1 ABC transporter substrate-binding protein [Actinophytocola sp.]
MGRRGSVLVAIVALIGLSTACETKSGRDSGAPADTDEPIVVGSTLSLSGAFAATGAIHELAGKLFVDRLNADGGLLGREVRWVVRDDESDQAKVSTLYEQLISQDQVDLIIGPYATPNILSAMAVALRHGFTMPQHTSVLAPLMDYECQFPGWSIGPEPNKFVPDQLFDAVASLPNPPTKVAIVTNQNGSTDFISYGSDADRTGAVSIATQRGLDVVAEVRYPPTTTDWAPIATQVRDAAPDLVINNGLGVDPVNLLQAMAQLNYTPPLMFSLFPAPGPPLGLGATADGLLSVTIFEPNKSTLDKLGPEATEIVDEFQSRAEAADLPYTVFETQAAASWTAWEILAAAVEGSGGLDQQALCDELHANGATTTFNGDLTFDPEVNNFWPPTQAIKQIQDSDWVTVWPTDRAAAQLRRPAS